MWTCSQSVQGIFDFSIQVKYMAPFILSLTRMALAHFSKSTDPELLKKNEKEKKKQKDITS